MFRSAASRDPPIVLVAVKKAISVKTRSAWFVDELVESVAVLDTSKLNAPRFNRAAVKN